MDSVSVSVYPLPAFTLSAVGTSCSDYTDGSVSSTLTTTQPVVYLWSTTATTAHLNGVGVGNYSLTVVDANGCTAVDSIDVISLDLDSCLVIPSVFTPNNDGKNDKFEIKHIELFPNATVEIYNRWGDLVFKSDNYANPSEWWDGTYNGKDATLGSFVYIIKLSPEKDPINGIISIVK
jgi:gliding motility-associated-like protein